MKKRRIKAVISLILAVSVLSACTARDRERARDGSGVDRVQDRQEASSGTGAGREETTPPGNGGGQEGAVSSGDLPGQESGGAQGQEGDVAFSTFYTGDRPLLIRSAVEEDADGVIPCVEAYTVRPDLGNVDNLWQFYLEDGMKEKLSENGFVVSGSVGREFFEVYEMNRYAMIPNFVTVDSLMHTYHLYFGYLLKNIEKKYLSDNLTRLSGIMLADSAEQYERLKGSEWESAARRNVAFFTVGASLLDGRTEVRDYVKDMAGYELDSIRQAEGVSESEITGLMEDYTQYIPRGYYEGDERLEQYFRAMMWYGRAHFLQYDEDTDRSAFLISMALLEDAEAYALWESIYAVTSFFAGASDDLGACEYMPLIRDVYGDDVTVGELAGSQDAFVRFHGMTAGLSAPQINSIPIFAGQDNEIPGFRFMGQRFTVDAAVMQQLVFGNVKQNSRGEERMLPDVLDVPAALGSDAALRILTEMGETDYAGYPENMERLREGLAQENRTLWSASLYANWLNTLRPLLDEKGKGYPMFMQNEEWVKKDLECFAGSFTELKHDTVLYSKQVIAEMGGDYYEEIDDRGYVEPEPLVYARFAGLTELTAQGLKEYGMLDAADEENLARLTQMAKRLRAISIKELEDEVLTDEEYEFIKCYGGDIEHFWYEVAKDASASDDMVAVQEFPAAVVVDIATNPDGGWALELATDDPSMILVAVKVDGKIKLARGSVYSFYQFIWPSDDRLTDLKWRRMIGIQSDEDGNFHDGSEIQQPDWTKSYRYYYEK